MNILGKVKNIFLVIAILYFSIVAYGKADGIRIGAGEFKYGLEHLTSERFECLSKQIYFEARGESAVGMAMVARATINRVRHSFYPDNICDVVWEWRWSNKKEKWVPMFSWTLDGIDDNPDEESRYHIAKTIAIDILLNNRYDTLFQGVTHFHAVSIKPAWHNDFKRISRIDNHVTYRMPDRGLPFKGKTRRGQ